MTGIEPAVAAQLGIAAASTAVGMATSSAQQSAQRKARQRQIAHQHQQAALQQRIRERQAERKKRKELAAARARLGAAGVGSSSGSGAAVLSGLQSQFDRQIAEQRDIFINAQNAPTSLLNDAPQHAQALLGLGHQVVGILGEKSSNREK